MADKISIRLSPIRHELREGEVGLKSARATKHYDESRNFRWLRSSHTKMMTAGAVNGRLRDEADIGARLFLPATRRTAEIRRGARDGHR